MSFLSLITGSYKNKIEAKAIFSETESYEKGFSNHYNQYIKPYVIKFEESRISALNIASKRARIGVLIYIFILMSCLYVGFLAYRSNRLLGEDSFFELIFIVWSLSSFIFLWINRPIKKYSSSIKSDIFPNILSFFGDFKYQEKEDEYSNDDKTNIIAQNITSDFVGNLLSQNVSIEDLAKQPITKISSSIISKNSTSKSVSNLGESDIIPNHNRVYSEDFIAGKYKEVDIKLFETKLEKVDGSGKHQSRKTVFKGVIISLSVHKNFQGKTIIIKDRGKLRNWMKSKFSNLENVKLEDTKFEKLFEVFSSDQTEARYLLTVSFMERLLQLQESFKSQKIECSFYDNKLLIMIPVKKNLFETGSIFEAEDFVDDAKSLLKEMNIIFQIIDILKLNQNIGL